VPVGKGIRASAATGTSSSREGDLGAGHDREGDPGAGKEGGVGREGGFILVRLERPG
jgi:hypothetical protein